MVRIVSGVLGWGRGDGVQAKAINARITNRYCNYVVGLPSCLPKSGLYLL